MPDFSPEKWAIEDRHKNARLALRFAKYTPYRVEVLHGPRERRFRGQNPFLALSRAGLQKISGISPLMDKELRPPSAILLMLYLAIYT